MKFWKWWGKKPKYNKVLTVTDQHGYCTLTYRPKNDADLLESALMAKSQGLLCEVKDDKQSS